MAISPTTGVALLLALLSAAFYFKPKAGRSPPGPKPLPLIGNLLDFPVDYAWFSCEKWKKSYGDVVQLNTLGTRIVILNSLQACTDLLDKRSAKYSGRPHLTMLGELMGWDVIFSLMHYSPRWRQQRRLFHEHFSANGILAHRPVQQRCNHIFLQRLLNDPEHLFDHLRVLFGETITEVVYGIKIDGPNDIVLKQAEDAAQTFITSAVPGKYLVDVFPLLKYIPAWFPGAGFKRKAAEWNEVGRKMRDIPFAHVEKGMVDGTAPPSVVRSMLSNGEAEDLQNIVKNCASSAYLGGADTTHSAIKSFFLAMANYPAAQKAAQEELDAFLGDSSLPTFEDADHLPFVGAVIKEVLRWHNPTPLGFSHLLTEDDEYKGYKLRRGTVVLGNIWSVLHDPEVYSDPHAFNPWRWILETPDGIKLNGALPDPSVAVFGFGRRICPGRFFALQALFITVASVLTCFDIRPLDSKRKPVDKLKEAFTGGLFSHPEPFNVSITPRSDKIALLLRDLQH